MNSQAAPPSAPPAARYRHVFVAVSSPETAPALLEIGAAMCDPKHGSMVAAFVAIDGKPDSAEPYGELEALVDAHITERGIPTALQVYPSDSVARGLLDAVREESADLLIIGAQNLHDRDHPFGLMIEAVIRAAPCPLMVYYLPSKALRRERIARIVVSIDESDNSRVALRAAAHLADGLRLPAEVVHIRRQQTSENHSRAVMQSTMKGVHGAAHMDQRMISADNPVDALLARLTKNHLLVIGFEKRELMGRWLFGGFSRRLIDHATFPILMAAELPDDSEAVSEQVARLLNWFNARMTDFEQDELSWKAGQMAAPTLDFSLLMILASVIATAGMLLDSPTLIIGAMIIAPMQNPITAFSVGLATQRPQMLIRSLVTIGAGVLLTGAVGFVIGLLQPAEIMTEQMLSWSNPTMLDALVAGGAGVAGAWGMARKSVAESLAGVAVATSLNPAISLIGLGLARGDGAIMSGALLLFVTNFICIALAGWGVFTWMGMDGTNPATRAARTQADRKSRLTQYRAIAALTLLALPAIILLIQWSNRRVDSAAVLRGLDDAFASSAITDMDITQPTGENPLHVILTVRSSEPITVDDVTAARDQLQESLDQPVELEVVELRMVQPNSNP